MCIGRPMQLTERCDDDAICADGNAFCRIDIRLTPDAQTGDWLLVFLGAARRVISAEEAAAISDALDALDAAEKGKALDAFFGDLTAREPKLPEHMEIARRTGKVNV